MTEHADTQQEETSTAVVERPATVAPTVFDADPGAVMEQIAAISARMKEFVRAQGLTVRFGDSEHLRVEAWQFIGQQIGARPGRVDTKPIAENGDGYEARVELVDRDGRVIGEGRSRCTRSERNWKGADDYAIESMAQTRAIGKAYRNSYGFIAKAAGYDPTPAEEMTEEMTKARSAPKREASAPAPTPKAQAESPPASDEKLATAAQQRLIFGKFKEAGGPQEPADRDKVPHVLRAILWWMGGDPHPDRIARSKVDEVLDGIRDHEGTIAQIHDAAADAERPDGPEARQIVDTYLGGGEQGTLGEEESASQ